MTPASEDLDATGIRVSVVAARFNAEITELLLDGAIACLEKHGAPEPTVDLVPGSFEIPVVARARAASGSCDAVVALGCVVRGETAHFDLVAEQCARGIMDAMLATGIPIAFGVLATETFDQARARAGGAHGNIGWDATLSAIETVATLRRIASDPR